MQVCQGKGLEGLVVAELAVKQLIERLYGYPRAKKEFRGGWLRVVGDGVGSVVEDVVVGGDGGFLEVIAGYWPLDDRWGLGQGALAGAAGVELVRWEDSTDFEWFEHVFLLGKWFRGCDCSQPLGLKFDLVLL